jgi:hypothetical protein
MDTPTKVMTNDRCRSPGTVERINGPSEKKGADRRDVLTYDPARTNDVRLGPWTHAGLADLKRHFLGRLL